MYTNVKLEALAQHQCTNTTDFCSKEILNNAEKQTFLKITDGKKQKKKNSLNHPLNTRAETQFKSLGQRELL